MNSPVCRCPIANSPQLGASPLLLPPPLPLGTLATGPGAARGSGGARRQADAGDTAAGAPQHRPAKGIVDGVMPDEGTLQRSRFLSALTPAMAAQYAQLLDGAVVAAAKK